MVYQTHPTTYTHEQDHHHLGIPKNTHTLLQGITAIACSREPTLHPLDKTRTKPDIIERIDQYQSSHLGYNELNESSSIILDIFCINDRHCCLPFNMSNIELLAQRCDELESHNNALRTKNIKLQNRLTRERRYFAEMSYTLKYEMDVLKNMIAELEDQVATISPNQHISTTHSINSNPEIDPYCADDFDDIRCAETQHNQCNIKQLGSLCDSEYRELEGQLHHYQNEFQKKMNQSTQQLPQQHQTSQVVSSPIKKMVVQVLSLKKRVQKKSLHISKEVNNGYVRSSLCRSSSCRDGTDATETTAEASFSMSCPRLTPSNSHCQVSSMRWKRADFHSGGLYSGQIDVSSKLPDGFGGLHCFCRDDNCYLKGEWRSGQLIQHLDSKSDVDDDCDEDKVKKTFSSDHLSTFIHDAQANVSNLGNCRDEGIFVQDLRGTLRNRFLRVHSFHGFRDSDSISVTEL